MSFTFPYRLAPEGGRGAHQPLVAVVGDAVNEIDVMGGPHEGTPWLVGLVGLVGDRRERVRGPGQ